MTGDIDYNSVDIPSHKTPDDYTYAERRAEILTLIEQSGHPGNLHQGQLADRYGCSPATISADINDHLAPYIDETIGRRRLLVTHAVIDRSLKGLLEEEEWRKAAQTVLDFNKWIDDYRDQEEFEDRLAEIEERLTNDESAPDLDGLTTNGSGVELRKNR